MPGPAGRPALDLVSARVDDEHRASAVDRFVDEQPPQQVVDQARGPAVGVVASDQAIRRVVLVGRLDRAPVQLPLDRDDAPERIDALGAGERLREAEAPLADRGGASVA